MKGSSPLFSLSICFIKLIPCSGRKIIEVLKKNPEKDPEGYDEGTSAFLFLTFFFPLFFEEGQDFGGRERADEKWKQMISSICDAWLHIANVI